MFVLHKFWLSGWGFDAVYYTLIVRPFIFMADINKNDVVDRIYSAVVELANFIHRIFAWTQSGVLRWYLMGIVVGAILILTIGLLV